MSLLFRPNESVKSIALLHDGALSWFKKKEKAVIPTYIITEDTGTCSVSREGACMFGGCMDIKEQWGEWKTLGNFQESVIQQNSLQAPERRLYQKRTWKANTQLKFPPYLNSSLCPMPRFLLMGCVLGSPYRIFSYRTLSSKYNEKFQSGSNLGFFCYACQKCKR